MVILGHDQRLSQSVLWQLQRDFFEHQGIAAWRRGIVPHHLSSNPYIAGSYAQVMMGFLRDVCSDPGFDRRQPVYVLELGAGSGRFGYHFLRNLHNLLALSPLHDVQVIYVLSDAAGANLAYWQEHPRLQPLVAAGRLDFARFEPEGDTALQLQRSGVLLTGGSLVNPMAVCANYFFDSIPADAFWVHDGALDELLVTVSAPDTAEPAGDAANLDRAVVAYRRRATRLPLYEDPDLDRILQEYSAHLHDTSLLFPVAGIRVVRNLARLSGSRMFLLAGDKGWSRPEDLAGRGDPELARHGSFSLMVNFHALGRYVVGQDGQVLETAQPHSQLNICGYLLGRPYGAYGETRLAYRQAIEEHGPDDFYSLALALAPHYAGMTLEQLLAHLRLSGWDARIVFDSFPVLSQAAAKASPRLQEEVRRAVDQVWATYFPIGEAADLPFRLGVLLSNIERHAEALTYFRRSLELHGEDPSTRYNMATSCVQLGEFAAAFEHASAAVALDPEFAAARRLRDQLERGLSRL